MDKIDMLIAEVERELEQISSIQDCCEDSLAQISRIESFEGRLLAMPEDQRGQLTGEYSKLVESFLLSSCPFS